MQQKIPLERVAWFSAKATAQAVADRIRDARSCRGADAGEAARRQA